MEIGKRKSEYGQDYNAHSLEIYKVFVEMADRISQRRQSANSFFLSINTAVIGMVGYIGFDEAENVGQEFYLLIGFAGITLCLLWFFIIRSYRSMNRAKFKVIHEIERILPIAPYDTEWKVAGQGKKPLIHIPFTYIEMLVPWVFLSLHIAVVFLGGWK